MKIKIFNPIYGVPITFLEKYSPEQFDIVAFRKGEDGKDLTFTRQEELTFNNSVELGGGSNALLSCPCKEEPIDLIHESTTSTAGVFNAGKEVEINGKQIYKRIIIRFHKK